MQSFLQCKYFQNLGDQVGIGEIDEAAEENIANKTYRLWAYKYGRIL